MTSTGPGLGGFAACFPPARVPLAAWAGWTGAPVDRVLARVGTAFRLCGPREDAYTLAAGAVLRLLLAYDVDPGRVGFLGLGTESSADDAAGAVIVKGLVDQGLQALGRRALPTDCELPELKAACLAGVYALKAALRYASVDGRGRQAIVVASDAALYPRGSSGEPTQGAGAVALLVEGRATLAEIDLAQGASWCQPRGPDFRKPHGAAPRDYPVYNGRYTALAYLDATLRAARALAGRRGCTLGDLLTDADAVFLHRPYRQLPINALAWLHASALGETAAGREALARVASEAGGSLPGLLEALQAPLPAADAPGMAGEIARRGEALSALRRLREAPSFQALLQARFVGFDALHELGNLYAASLPAWLAAGFEQALREGRAWAGARLLVLAYGSGDASEAFVLRPVDGWQHAAGRIGLAGAVAGAVDLDQASYERLHDRTRPPGEGQPGPADDGVTSPPGPRFELARVGSAEGPGFQDAGVRYYRFVA